MADRVKPQMEVTLRLPEPSVEHVEAAAGIVLFNKVLAAVARVRLRYLGGKGGVKPSISRVEQPPSVTRQAKPSRD